MNNLKIKENKIYLNGVQLTDVISYEIESGFPSVFTLRMYINDSTIVKGGKLDVVGPEVIAPMAKLDRSPTVSPSSNITNVPSVSTKGDYGVKKYPVKEEEGIFESEMHEALCRLGFSEPTKPEKAVPDTYQVVDNTILLLCRYIQEELRSGGVGRIANLPPLIDSLARLKNNMEG
ncbi:hypothetical protein [Paenibacillus pinihumi]|uniref:hypothetical protein n=1 Tax=Paenibacillus pinihumi TaxID=669462 RepID=UPI00048ACA10|nr:hypothetical protein [Paenibacillus pinihumi]